MNQFFLFNNIVRTRTLRHKLDVRIRNQSSNRHNKRGCSRRNLLRNLRNLRNIRQVQCRPDPVQCLSVRQCLRNHSRLEEIKMGHKIIKMLNWRDLVLRWKSRGELYMYKAVNFILPIVS